MLILTVRKREFKSVGINNQERRPRESNIRNAQGKQAEKKQQLTDLVSSCGWVVEGQREGVKVKSYLVQ